MKTVLTELIEFLNEANNSVFALNATKIELTMIKDFKKKCESLLEKEKEQIINAFRDGWLSFKIEDGKEYYKDKYGIMS